MFSLGCYQIFYITLLAICSALTLIHATKSRATVIPKRRDFTWSESDSSINSTQEVNMMTRSTAITHKNHWDFNTAEQHNAIIMDKKLATLGTTFILLK